MTRVPDHVQTSAINRLGPSGYQGNLPTRVLRDEIEDRLYKIGQAFEYSIDQMLTILLRIPQITRHTFGDPAEL